MSGAPRRAAAYAALALAVAALALAALGIGPVRLSPAAVAAALFGGGDEITQIIVRAIRLPAGS